MFTGDIPVLSFENSTWWHVHFCANKCSWMLTRGGVDELVASHCINVIYIYIFPYRIQIFPYILIHSDR